MAALVKKLQSAHPLWWGLAVSAGATLLSFIVPEAYAGSAVGLLFVMATVALALPRNAPFPPAHYGLSLSGLFDPAPLRLGHMLQASAQAFAIATLVGLVVLPPFWIGYTAWYAPEKSFSWQLAFAGPSHDGALGLADLALGHLLVVAFPEEIFFRGYLQSALDDRDDRRINLLGAPVGLSLITVSLLFALGHYATTLHLGRLAVFFPSLLFGWLRARTGAVGASIILHAMCNVFSALLARGYGL